jgi:hypothetical protein
MSTLKQYQIKIKNFTSKTPCDGFYVLTGMTQNINIAGYIYGTPTLYPITVEFTFNLEIESDESKIFVFVKHCDDTPPPIINPKLIGAYQLALVDLTCDDCYYPCEFGVDVIKLF